MHTHVTAAFSRQTTCCPDPHPPTIIPYHAFHRIPSPPNPQLSILLPRPAGSLDCHQRTHSHRGPPHRTSIRVPALENRPIVSALSLCFIAFNKSIQQRPSCVVPWRGKSLHPFRVPIPGTASPTGVGYPFERGWDDDLLPRQEQGHRLGANPAVGGMFSSFPLLN
jgi:hypothetical protein